VPALQAAESRDAVRHTTSTNARRWPDSGNPPRPISNPAPRSSRAQRRLGFGSKRRKNGAASEPIVDVDPNKRKRAGGLAGTKAIDRLHCCILPVHGGCTDLLLLPGAATASHLHLVVCPVDRAHLIPCLGRTQSGCPGKPAQPSVDFPRM
jgi:hypothetical protein